jgi:hypothetical protein
MQLRFVTYMTEKNAQNFSGELCRIDKQQHIQPKFRVYHQYDCLPTCVELYVLNKHLCRVHNVLQRGILASVGGRTFGPVATYFFAADCNISAENRVLVALLPNDEAEDFAYDVRHTHCLLSRHTSVRDYQITRDCKLIEVYAQDEAIASPLLTLLHGDSLYKHWEGKFIQAWQE